MPAKRKPYVPSSTVTAAPSIPAISIARSNVNLTLAVGSYEADTSESVEATNAKLVRQG
jgi:hypothetical protein